MNVNELNCRANQKVLESLDQRVAVLEEGGGSVDAYTKAETDALLADKLNGFHYASETEAKKVGNFTDKDVLIYVYFKLNAWCIFAGTRFKNKGESYAMSIAGNGVTCFNINLVNGSYMKEPSSLGLTIFANGTSQGSYSNINAGYIHTMLSTNGLSPASNGQPYIDVGTIASSKVKYLGEDVFIPSSPGNGEVYYKVYVRGE